MPAHDVGMLPMQDPHRGPFRRAPGPRLRERADPTAARQRATNGNETPTPWPIHAGPPVHSWCEIPRLTPALWQLATANYNARARMAFNPSIRIGCCGMQMARAKYFARFDLTEVQQTFYQPPKLDTLATWRAQAPPGFEFTLKAWQLITHTPHSPTYRRLRQPIDPAKFSHYGRFQLTDEVIAAWRTTLASARALASRIIVFQCPPSFGPSRQNLANLRVFFSYIRAECSGLILAWEPRGHWPRDLTLDLAAELNLLYVVDPFRSDAPPLDIPLRYYRLHGRTKYADQYTDDDLLRLRGWCNTGTTYVLFNNIPMVTDANRFRSMI